MTIWFPPTFSEVLILLYLHTFSVHTGYCCTNILKCLSVFGACLASDHIIYIYCKNNFTYKFLGKKNNVRWAALNKTWHDQSHAGFRGNLKSWFRLASLGTTGDGWWIVLPLLRPPEDLDLERGDLTTLLSQMYCWDWRIVSQGLIGIWGSWEEWSVNTELVHFVAVRYGV